MCHLLVFKKECEIPPQNMFEVGDRVRFQETTGHITFGAVTSVYSPDMMSILRDGYGGKVSVVAQKEGDEWFAYRSYTGYLEKVFKVV